MLPCIQLTNGITLYSYPTLIAAGLVAMFVYVLPRARRLGVGLPDVASFFGMGLSTLLLGSRLAWFLFYDRETLLGHPGALLEDGSGLCFLGGLAAIGLVLPVYAKAIGLPVMAFLALMAPAVAIGHAFGRVGCLMAGCCYGTPAEVPWSFAQPTLSGDALARHPTQLYELCILLGLARGLHLLLARGAAPGRVLGVYLVVLASERFFLEFLRGDTQAEALLLGLSNAQTLCVVLGVAGVALLTLSTGRESAGAGKKASDASQARRRASLDQPHECRTLAAWHGSW